MSLAHKSWEGELRRPARLFISRAGSRAWGGSAPATGSCCATGPVPQASRCCCCSGPEASARQCFLTSFYFCERNSERLEFALMGFSEEAEQAGCASPSDGEQVGKSRRGGEKVNGAAAWQI